MFIMSETTNKELNSKKRDKLKILVIQFKKISLLLLIGCILNISLTKGILMLNATILYASTGVPWFEVMNYLFLALAVLILPPLALLFLDSEYMRRLLRFYLLIIIFFNIFELSEGIFNKFDSVWIFERSQNVILILFETFSALICWLILLRQIAGHSVLPIPIKTKMYISYSITELLILNPIRHLVDFVRKPLFHNRKRVNIVIAVNILIFSGLLITFIPENSIITINNPSDHRMRVSFWGGQNLNNSTLDILSTHDSRLFVWANPIDEAKWQRFDDRNINIIVVNGFESNESLWTQDLAEMETIINILDTQNHTSVVGFADDMEMLTRIIEFNQSYYDKYVSYIQNKTNFVQSRGYEYHVTQWLASLNDYRDSDNEMSVVYKNPFDPVRFANLSSIGWMIYRSEMAIKYDEPYDYFTHHWASQVYNYMDFIEKQNNYVDGFWKNKSTISIGVTEESSLYTFNIDLNPKARDNFMQELKICHANRISEVIIFIAGETDSTGAGTEGFFRMIGGDEGLIQMYNELESYEEVKIVYKRRATFFGNLKMLSNSSGSVFGLFYSDVIYNSSTGIFVYLWLAIFIISGICIKKLHIPEESIIENEGKFDRNSCIIRTIFTLLLLAFFLVVYMAFRWPELLIIIQNVDYFLKIFY